MSTTIDPAFEGVGKVPGLTLWRIEKKLVVKQPVVSGRLESFMRCSWARQHRRGGCETSLLQRAREVRLIAWMSLSEL